ncbi:MAG: tryptophan synthase subunit alpha, partial [Longimicrobiales bacterium]
MSESRIRERLERTLGDGRRALIPYLTSGFPTPARTLPLMTALADLGVDVIELGIPFSDPLADG